MQFIINQITVYSYITIYPMGTYQHILLGIIVKNTKHCKYSVNETEMFTSLQYTDWINKRVKQ